MNRAWPPRNRPTPPFRHQEIIRELVQFRIPASGCVIAAMRASGSASTSMLEVIGREAKHLVTQFHPHPRRVAENLALHIERHQRAVGQQAIGREIGHPLARARRTDQQALRKGVDRRRDELCLQRLLRRRFHHLQRLAAQLFRWSRDLAEDQTALLQRRGKPLRRISLTDWKCDVRSASWSWCRSSPR